MPDPADEAVKVAKKEAPVSKAMSDFTKNSYGSRQAETKKPLKKNIYKPE